MGRGLNFRTEKPVLSGTGAYTWAQGGYTIPKTVTPKKGSYGIVLSCLKQQYRNTCMAERLLMFAVSLEREENSSGFLCFTSDFGNLQILLFLPGKKWGANERKNFFGGLDLVVQL